MIERILILVRNVLHIPSDPSEENHTDDDASTQDQVCVNSSFLGIILFEA